MNKKIILTCCLVFFTLLSHARPTNLLNDSHVHLTNYIMKGPTLSQYLYIMNKNGVSRSAIFGLPLKVEWNMAMDKEMPAYYAATDAKMYYYSAIDPMIAREYLELSAKDQKRFDVLLCGFNPTDGGAGEHIKRMIHMYPGVFSGIGEFSVYKEIVSGKTYGKSMTLKDKSLANILNIAAEIGLITLIHTDIDAIGVVSDKKPAYFDDTYALFKRHPNNVIIWAHTGLGRFVKPTDYHFNLLKKMLRNCPNVYCDISWSEVAKTITKDSNSLKIWKNLISEFPDRFLFGTDSVAPNEEGYRHNIELYDKFLNILSNDVKMKLLVENHNRLFDNASKKVRSWEKENVKPLVPKLNWPFAEKSHTKNLLDSAVN